MAELTAAQTMMLEAKRRAAEKRGADFDMEAEMAKILKPKATAEPTEPAKSAAPAPTPAKAEATPPAAPPAAEAASAASDSKAELTIAQTKMLEAKRRAAQKRGDDFDMAAETAKLLKPKSAAKPAASTPAPAKAEAAPAVNEADSPAPVAAKPAVAKPTVAKPTAAKTTKAAPAKTAPVPEPAGQDGINRREFLTYAWGAALGLIAAQGGLATYMFTYPRFKEGEFGGKFRLGSATILPAIGTPPEGNATGKFWLVQTEEGVKALYMVCTHLGCLYKWETSNNRFECPCHGSKFTASGEYIEGPAPRALDQFVVEVLQNGEVVSTTTDTPEAIVAAPILSPDDEIVVDTGSKILGKHHA